MRFVIDREKWLRGKGSHQSVLLRGDGMQCCVGQMCSQIGVPDEVIKGAPTIALLLMREYPKPLSPEVFGPLVESDPARPPAQFDFVGRAYGINDNVCYDDEEREEELSKLFAINGHDLVFTD